MAITPNIWTIRHAIYRHFAATARAPTLAEIAATCHLTRPEAEEALLALDKLHAIFLDPGTFNIQIANPFSGVPTDFKVTVGGRIYSANCAWDTFGIIAALQSKNGTINANCAENGTKLTIEVREGEEVSSRQIIHFLVPFSKWYEDMVFT